MTFLIIGWVLTALVLACVLGKRVYHKLIIEDLRYQMKFLDRDWHKMRNDRLCDAHELLKLRAFHKRFTALISATKKRKK